MPTTADKARKSSRRQRAAESLHEHLDDPTHSAEIDYGYDDEEDVAESWSSHDISAGASKASSNRRSSTGANSTSSGSRRPRTKMSDGSARRERSPTSSNSVSREHRSAYKGLGKLSMKDNGEGGMKDGSRRSSGPSRRTGDRSHRGDSSSNLSMSSSSRRRDSASASAGGSDKLQRILELGNKWKTMKEQHDQITEQATTRRVDLKKEIF